MFKEKTRDLFIPYIMAGDPSSEATVQIALTLQQSGAVALELGVPFSDPLADGPVIQRAGMRALEAGMTLKKAIELVEEMRQSGVEIPIIIFTYYNPVLQLGKEYFISLLLHSGADGALIPDLPYEESKALKQMFQRNGLSLISLLAPTSKERMERISKEADGFLYCISSLGVTGERENFHENLQTFVSTAKQYATVPVVIGFGISNREQVKQMQQLSDGVIIGSAIVREIEQLSPLFQTDEERAIEQLRLFIQKLIE
ncbi:tryptophan synthase subunit alpha [Massilibacterium senegalense]|uniref:tryptophan synthase subunit alpha n=1 Tax=Massilibacterium senegalense TaxID=1632858 RepID=UPI000780EEF5|nr:tryptophan synthase subunit alpha [Massilibacterium senegalense]